MDWKCTSIKNSSTIKTMYLVLQTMLLFLNDYNNLLLQIWFFWGFGVVLVKFDIKKIQFFVFYTPLYFFNNLFEDDDNDDDDDSLTLFLFNGNGNGDANDDCDKDDDSFI
jgi:hypothetical protein